MGGVCCPSYLRRLWREEPWGYPARPQVAILSLKFPAGVRNPALTRTYRLLFAIGWTFWIIWSAIGAGVIPSPEWCVFVTDWTAAMMGGYAWAALLSTLLPHVRWLDAAAWFLHGIAAPLTVMVTVLFWSTYSGSASPPGSHYPDSPTNPVTIHMHGVNAILMLMDLTLARYPYQLKHFPAPLGFIACYLAFNYTYWRETGTVVYGALDYAHPLSAVLMIAAALLVLFPFVHLILWRYELACFAFSERRRYAAARQASLKDLVPGDRDVEAGASKAAPKDGEAASNASASATARPSLRLSDAVLATRRVAAQQEMQTPSTAGTGLEMSGSGGSRGGDVESSPGAAAAVATATATAAGPV